ncbi:MAG: hypothetical protein E7Z63_06140 [Thermoplasmata archaeon]|nr:hypothetical protein [Thermoplasmata archaeon]
MSKQHTVRYFGERDYVPIPDCCPDFADLIGGPIDGLLDRVRYCPFCGAEVKVVDADLPDEELFVLRVHHDGNLRIETYTAEESFADAYVGYAENENHLTRSPTDHLADVFIVEPLSEDEC